MVRAAAAGDESARQGFAAQYSELVRSYIARQWRRNPRMRSSVDDAAQDVFLECLRPSGVLTRATPERGSFRALLFGVIRNVMRRFETEQQRGLTPAQPNTELIRDVPAEDPSQTRLFDRMWAEAILREAAARHRLFASSQGALAEQRMQILEMRHRDGLPIRQIAARLGRSDTEALHNDYRRARREYGKQLRAVVTEWTGITGDAELDEECRGLGTLLAEGHAR